MDLHPFYVGYKLCNGCIGGGPAGTKANHGLILIQGLPEAGLVLGSKIFSLGCSENGELLVGVRIKEEGNPLFLEGLPNQQRLLHRLFCQVKIEVVSKQGLELDSQKPSLCQHSALLLDKIAEILLQSWIGNHHCLSKQGSLLCAANVEDVCKTSNILKATIVLGRSQSVA